MDADDFKAVWADGVEQSFAIMSQPVVWNANLPTRKTLNAIVDALPFSNEQKKGGGGFIEEFLGNILFLKSDFGCACTATNSPQPGDQIQIGKRMVRITEIANRDDAADPTIHCYYKPLST